MRVLQLAAQEGFGRFEPAVQIDGGDQRLVAVGQQRLLEAAAGLLLAAAQDQMLAEPELLGMPRQRLRRDDGGLDLRLLAFVVVRVLMEQRVGHDQAEHGVAEKLERLVVGHAARRILGRARLVRQRVLEQAAIAEPVVDARLQLVELVAQAHDARADVLAMAVDDAARLVGGRSSATATRISPSALTAIGQTACVLPEARKLGCPDCRAAP